MTFTPEIYYRVYSSPRISAAMLGDYMAAEDDERETIIRNAKYAKTTRVVTYRDARKLLRRFLGSDLRRIQDLHDSIESWEEDLGNPLFSEYQKDERRACIEAIKAFLSNYNRIGFSGFSITRAPAAQPKLLIEGVKVSTHLDSLIMQMDKKNNKRVGGLLLQMSKGKAEGKREETIAKRAQAGAYTGLLVLKQVAVNFGAMGIPKSDICFFANVQRGNLWTAPDSHKRAFSRVDAAARGIYLRWPSIGAPADFDPDKAKFSN
jgi:hypothetical protein